MRWYMDRDRWLLVAGFLLLLAPFALVAVFG